MAGNNTSGQDSRLPGASQQFPIAPDDSIEPEGGRTSAEVYKKPRRSTASKEDTHAQSSKSKSRSSVTSPSGDSSSTKGSKRTQFSPQQIYKLEQFFLENQFPSAKDRENLAKEIQLSAKHIQVWFQNHRAKYKRKEKKKEATQKSAVKLKPPSSWPANIPFDSSIASLGSGQEKKETYFKQSREQFTETVERTGSVSPSLSASTASEEVSTLQSSSSPEKLAAYPLSPSSPLPTPHAPSRRRSSSLAPESPLSSVCSPSLSPVHSQSASISQSPASHASSTTTTSHEPSQVYTDEISALSIFDINFQTTDFSPPIFAESPVHLYDLLDDPEIASILREHLPPPKEISITDTDFSLPRASFSTQPPYYQSSISQVGYSGSQRQFHQPDYVLPSLPPPSLPGSQRTHLQSHPIPSPSNPTAQPLQQDPQKQHQQQSLSLLLRSSSSPAVRPLPPQTSLHQRPPMAPMHASRQFPGIHRPRYPQSLHQHYPTQQQMTYQNRPSLPLDTPQFPHVPFSHTHQLSSPMATQVQPPIYLFPSPSPSLPPQNPQPPLTTSSSTSSALLYQSPGQKPPTR